MNAIHFNHRRLAWGVASLCLVLTRAAGLAGTVTMDGSLPGNVGVSGQTYTISAGRVSGANQFYSFQQLNLVKNDFASFTIPGGVGNVFARVSGGASSIDGTISAAGASFFLINNQGVVFGPDARLNVGGTFAVTTADELKFADGKVFTAAPSGSDATLSAAAPAAFGFLSAQPASVSINGSSLTATAGKPVAIAAGNVTIQGGTITSSGGAVAITSVGSSGSAVINGSVGSAPTVSSFSQLGSVQITGGSIVNVDGATGGGIAVRAGSLTLTSSSLSAQTTGAGNGVGYDIDLTGDLNDTNTGILSNTTGAGNAGNISLTAQNMTFSGASALVDSGDVSGAGAAGGNITLSAANLTVENGAQIKSTSSSSAAGGNITATVSGNITLNSGADPSAISGISAQEFGGGIGGRVIVSAGTLSMANGGNISASTDSTGAGGNILVGVQGAATFNGTTRLGSSGIYAASDAATGGPGGSIGLSAGTLAIQNGAQVSSNTQGMGAGGNIVVSVNGVATLNGGVNGATPAAFCGIFATSSLAGAGGGNGGNITVTAGGLSIYSGAVINTFTSGAGSAGNITLNITGPVLLDGSADTARFTGLNVGSSQQASGNVGGVTLTSDSLTMNDGQIADVNSGTGAAGAITIQASQSASIGDTSLLTASAGRSYSGGITLTADNSIFINHSFLTAYAGISGADINLTASNVFGVADSSIQAHANLVGGTITIGRQLVIVGQDSQINTYNSRQNSLITFAPAGGFVLTGGTPILFNQPQFNAVGSVVVASLAVMQVSPEVLNGPLQASGAIFANETSSPWIVSSNHSVPPQPGGWLPFLIAEPMSGSGASTRH